VIFRRRARRRIGPGLIGGGVGLMLLAPETFGGEALFALAVLLEFVALAPGRCADRA